MPLLRSLRRAPRVEDGDEDAIFHPWSRDQAMKRRQCASPALLRKQARDPPPVALSFPAFGDLLEAALPVGLQSTRGGGPALVAHRARGARSFV